jgi:cyclophilin family peptidyl-prolyl cis-trans isomerase
VFVCDEWGLAGGAAQFYITRDAAPWLDPDFVVFGQGFSACSTAREHTLRHVSKALLSGD